MKAQDSLLAEQYVIQALDCIERDQNDSAKLWHKQALEIFQKGNFVSRWYTSHRTLAEKWVAKKQPFVALEYLAPVIWEKIQARRTKEESGKLMSLCSYSGYICEQKTNDLEGAVKYYEQTYQVFVNDLGENNEAFAKFLYHRLGNLYTRLGDYVRAENILKRGVEYGKKINKPEIGKYGDLAIILNDLGRHKEALEVIRQGLVLTNLPLNARITSHLSESVAWLGLGDVPKALEAIKDVPSLIEQLTDEEDKHNYSGGYYARLGDIHSALKNWSFAAEAYQQSIENERALGTHRREVGKAYRALADFYLHTDQPNKALEEYQHTLQSVLPEFRPLAADDNPPDSLLKKPENTIIEGLLGKAQCFIALNKPEKALECYERIPQVEAKLIATHAYESSSWLTLEESRRRLESAIHIAWRLYEQTGDMQYAHRAFRLTEQERGILLLKTLSQAQADYHLSDSIRNRENTLRVKKAWYEQQIAEEKTKSSDSRDSLRLEKLSREHLDLIQEENRFLADLSAENPGYQKLLDEVRFLSVADIPAILRPKQAFVDYFLSEDIAFIYLITPNGELVWHRQNLPTHFRDSFIQPFVEYLARGADKTMSKARHSWFKQTSFELYKLLLAPVLTATQEKFDALIIVPDDVLAFLPFDILLQQKSQAAWHELPYLLHQYSVSYAYSATVLARQQTNMREHTAANRIPFAGFAPKYGDTDRDPQTDEELYPIAGMKSMVEKVKKLLGGEVFEEDANEPTFAKIAPRCRVLLLAMHGFVHEKEPTLSRLLFGNPQKSGTPDNVLYTNELQITYLPADLVVLNACYSGFGKLQRGEGVYSVTRALTSAGVPATLMSIWKLHGASSPILIETFFKNIKKGLTKDEALQKAKIELLTNPNFDPVVHPFYWGGLLATGDMSALEF
ncbi:MAG: tetratricopeptide repeat protein [Saprospiraceae bacterium]